MRLDPYASGQLPSPSAGLRDMLSIISVTGGAASVSQLALSNSVTAAPEVLVLARDGRTAFVAERLAQRGPQAQTVRDLGPGHRLFAVDVAK